MLFDDKSRVYLKIVCKSQMTERGLWLLTKSVQFPPSPVTGDQYGTEG